MSNYKKYFFMLFAICSFTSIIPVYGMKKNHKNQMSKIVNQLFKEHIFDLFSPDSFDPDNYHENIYYEYKNEWEKIPQNISIYDANDIILAITSLSDQKLSNRLKEVKNLNNPNSIISFLTFLQACRSNTGILSKTFVKSTAMCSFVTLMKINGILNKKIQELQNRLKKYKKNI